MIGLDKSFRAFFRCNSLTSSRIRHWLREVLEFGWLDSLKLLQKVLSDFFPNS
jgi:hypothetical protein